MLLTHLFFIIYQINEMPLAGKKLNLLEIFNQWCLFFITFHMCLFTDFITSKTAQYNLGWSMIFFIIFMMAVNFIFVILNAVITIYLISLKYYRVLINTQTCKKYCPRKESPPAADQPNLRELITRVDKSAPAVPSDQASALTS